MKKKLSENILSQTAHSISLLGVKNASSILIAVSGGADSMTLAYILNTLRKQGHLKKLALIHINHSLRGKEADKDEALVKQFARKLKIPCYSFTVDTRQYAIANGMGIEEAARHLRYEKIEEIAAKNKFQFVATAHTANDQAETVLMNIIRGAGINGLQGIPETRKLSVTAIGHIGPISLIRPILSISKKEILSFAGDNKIPFREDKSNALLDFQRNRVRHLVLPKLERAFKDRDIYSGFSKMTRNISAVAEYIDGEVAKLREKIIVEQPSFFIRRKIISFDKDALLKAPEFLRRELILQEASSLSGKLISIDYVQSILMESYMSYKSHKTYKITSEIILTHDGKYITIENIDSPPMEKHLLIIGKRINTPIGNISAKKAKGWRKPIDANSAYFNYSELDKRQLLIRYWKPGDKMKPFGMKGRSRLVSDILNEFGIKSERLKYFVPLVVFRDEPDLILWIPGIRSAEFGRLTSKSETALELRRIVG
jgi:tRNA(Ile)-lysidine synthase